MVGHDVAATGLALRDLVFMMGEDEIDAAGVEVEAVAEILAAHRRTLEVPAGTPLAPGTVPPVVSIFVTPGLPKGEIGNRILVVFVVGDRTRGTFFQLALVEAGEATVAAEAGDAIVDRAIG